MALQRLREAAEKAKIELSSSNNVSTIYSSHRAVEDGSSVFRICNFLWVGQFLLLPCDQHQKVIILNSWEYTALSFLFH